MTFNHKKAMNEAIFGKRHKECPLSASGIQHIDYKDVNLLSQFITERGKIIPRRITGVSCSYQKMLVKAIKMARHMALLPFVSEG